MTSEACMMKWSLKIGPRTAFFGKEIGEVWVQLEKQGSVGVMDSHNIFCVEKKFAKDFDVAPEYITDVFKRKYRPKDGKPGSFRMSSMILEVFFKAKW